ncbi:adenylosuccinate synthase [Methylobacterium sp. WL103]|uniref:adenylosuccinate synthase n=1 Tax=unclassified Methylobacterium TaxID=2615210 RepID=UPI0011C6F5F0|nr:MULTISPECIES: adenylosuccinate synthase [unclassified Methylobacterium]TXM73284.1 adenylosuccinate synthase [Methylobacterium sp. WL12]TXM94359.1 adenylosuccinate synthase [Methylobacterium sp. WL103]
MAFKAKSASETKAADLASALVRIADRDGAPLQVGVDRLRQGNPRLTPLAIGQLYRKHRDHLDTALAERGYVLVGYADQGPGRGMEFAIDPA